MKKTFYNRREQHAVYRDTPAYPSAELGRHLTGKTERQHYTGTYVIGIATMHKSNAVPVTAGVNTNPKLHQGGTE